MKGLLLKDFYVLWKQIKLFLLMVVIYSFTPIFGEGNFSVGFTVIFCAMLPITVMGLDEKVKWDRVAASMPYSRRELVISKYILGLLCLLFAGTLAAAGVFVRGFLFKSGISGEMFLSIVPVMSIGLIFQAINFPIHFKIGVEKGRLFFLIITVFIVGGLGGVLSIIKIDTASIETLLGNILLLPAGALIISFLSAMLSIRIFNKREI